MKFVIGNGKNLMDWTYVGNVAQSHIEVRGEEWSRLAGRLAAVTPMSAVHGKSMRTCMCTAHRMSGDVVYSCSTSLHCLLTPLPLTGR